MFTTDIEMTCDVIHPMVAVLDTCTLEIQGPQHPGRRAVVKAGVLSIAKLYSATQGESQMGAE